MLVNLFMAMSIFLSTGMCLIMNSWIGVWIMLELNTLSFCAFMKTFKNMKQKTTEWSMKYFVIQSIASALLIFSSLSMKISLLEKVFLLTASISIMVKIAASPFHQWFVIMSKSSNWKNACLLMTWQKLAPIFLILYQLKTITWTFIVASIVSGAALQVNKKKVLEILSLSSVFNLGWMMAAIILNSQTFFLFTSLYWTSVLALMWMASNSNFKDISQEMVKNFPKWAGLMVLANLAGLPPFPNFITKMFVLSEGIKNNLLSIMTLMLVISSVNLFIYLRMLSPMLMKSFISHQKMNEKCYYLFTMMVILVTTLPIMVMSN